MNPLFKRFVISLALAAVLVSCNFGTAPGGTEGEGLTGIMVDTHGAPVANMRVKVYPDSTVGMAKRQVTAPRIDSVITNGAGRFDFKGLISGGRYNLVATFSRGDTVFSIFIQDIVYAGGRQDLGNKSLVVSGGVIVQVKTGNTSPASGSICRVPGSPFYGTIVDSGKCTLTGLPPGTFRIEILVPGFQTTLTDALTVIQGIISNGGSIELIPTTGPTPSQTQHFSLTSSTVALWTFNEYASGPGNKFADKGEGGNTLSGSDRLTLETSPYGSAVVFDGTGKFFSANYDSSFTTLGTGKITMEARIFLNAYPQGSFSASAEIMGMYPGPRVLIRKDGTLYVSMQKVSTVGDTYWYGAITRPATVPLGRWVDVALAFDTTVVPKQVYAYIDGEPVQLYYESDRGGSFVVPISSFSIGNDVTDNLPLNGKVDEARVSNSLVLGAGLPLAQQADSITSAVSQSTSRTWVPVASGTTNTILDIHFPTASRGYVAVAQTVLKTTNGGTSWTTVGGQALVDANAGKSVFFQNADTGWVTGGYDGSYSGLVKTTNGGSTWTQVSLTTTRDLYTVHFVGKDTGWVVGAGGTILKTVNGGTTWNAQNAGTNDWISCHFVNGSVGFVGGSSGVIMGTTNGGTTWTSRLSSTAGWIWNIHFPQPSTGYAVGYSGAIFKTTNSGATWSEQTSGVSLPLRSVHFVNANTGSASGDGGTLLSTTNGGTNWKKETVGTTNSLGAVFVQTPTNILTGGNVGVFFKGTGELP